MHPKTHRKVTFLMYYWALNLTVVRFRKSEGRARYQKKGESERRADVIKEKEKNWTTCSWATSNHGLILRRDS